MKLGPAHKSNVRGDWLLILITSKCLWHKQLESNTFYPGTKIVLHNVIFIIDF